MKDHPNLYILTYDHGGFVLWKSTVYKGLHRVGI